MQTKFSDLIGYEIYPTSFKDANGDGIGDLPGIIEKLDYVRYLGFNAIWFNPFYVSPFKDGGYDVEDFFDVDPKFGTLKDFDQLVAKAHSLGIRVILDLVAGHASFQNKDFLRSAEPARNEMSDLFIWNENVWVQEEGLRLISGMFQRHGCYMVNFFAHQPAFNYGFKRVDHPKWQMSYKDERTLQARNYLLDIMRFWLSRGADGFRVDMADSLVKNDDDKSATIEVWQWLFERIRKEFPDAYFVSEWSNPNQALKAGFDADFVLDHWDNFYHRFFRSDASSRGTSVLNGADTDFALKDLKERYAAANKYHRSLSLISGNHDTWRIANYLDDRQLRLFYLMILTLPGTPFILYGDELAMKTSHLPSKDGGFQRTGTRIPMLWNDEEKHGFTVNDEPYLPFFEENRVSAESAMRNKRSLLHYIRRLIKLRYELPDLREARMTVRDDHRVLTFSRGDYRLIINLSQENRTLTGKVIISSAAIKNDILPPGTGALCRI